MQYNFSPAIEGYVTDIYAIIENTNAMFTTKSSFGYAYYQKNAGARISYTATAATIRAIVVEYTKEKW